MKFNQIKKLVNKKLSEYKSANQTLESFDIIDFAKFHNIEILKAEFPNDISGAYKPANPGEKAKIYINASHHKNRMRFTIAHELGHHFLNHIEENTHVDNVIYRDKKSSLSLNKNEIEANQFAAELLMPSDIVEQCVDGLLDQKNHNWKEIIEKASLEFDVSQEAMSYKLKSLGYDFL